MTFNMTSETISIQGGRVVAGHDVDEAEIVLAAGSIESIGAGSSDGHLLDARGLLVLPGIVDIHGDAFERQMMPRPGVDFPVDVALVDSDRQALANGMTTVFHAATWSWEPGLRGTENAHRLIDAIESQGGRLAADTRFDLRHETFNLDAEPTILEWLAAGRIGLLAFNDHMSSTVRDLSKPAKRARMVDRSGLTNAQFDELVERTMARGFDVPASIERLTAAARAHGVAMLSHDDDTPERRREFRSLGIAIAEFPVNEATAREACSAGEFTVFGAPNVVRGGSHTGWIGAAEMVQKGLCSILASDYYYPAPLLAAFRLVADGILDLPQAWRLVSANPAAAAGLHDRGEIRQGLRADVILVDDSEIRRPRLVAAIAGGRLVYLADSSRLFRSSRVSHKVAAA